MDFVNFFRLMFFRSPLSVFHSLAVYQSINLSPGSLPRTRDISPGQQHEKLVADEKKGKIRRKFWLLPIHHEL